MPAMAPTMRMSRRQIPLALEVLDRVFPPNANTFMSSDQQTQHEIVKASQTMGSYVAELGTDRVGELDILDFGCGWGGETLWLPPPPRSVRRADVHSNPAAPARPAPH